jgi:hypothetical protein
MLSAGLAMIMIACYDVYLTNNLSTTMSPGWKERIAGEGRRVSDALFVLLVVVVDANDSPTIEAEGTTPTLSAIGSTCRVLLAVCVESSRDFLNASSTPVHRVVR